MRGPYPYMSRDGGSTWQPALPGSALNFISSFPYRTWTGASVSADGQAVVFSCKLPNMFGGDLQVLLTSNDGGATYRRKVVFFADRYWNERGSDVLLTADASATVARVPNGGLLVSIDGGATWPRIPAPLGWQGSQGFALQSFSFTGYAISNGEQACTPHMGALWSLQRLPHD